MDAARQASHEHPARVLGVILGDGRGARRGQRPGRHRRGLVRRDRPDPAQGRGRQAPRVGRAAAAAARLPRRRLVAHRPPRRPGRRPARPARPAPDHRRRVRLARQDQGAARPVRGVRPRQHRPGLDPDHAVAGAARRRPRPAPAQGPPGHGDRRADQPQRRPAACLARRPAAGRRPSAPSSDGPGHHRGGHGDRRGRDPDRPPRRQAGRLLLPRPARPAGRAQAPRPAGAAGRGAALDRRGRHLRRDRQAPAQARDPR